MQPAGSMGAKPVVVVVNDDQTQLRILAGLLEKQGMCVHAFTRADTAITQMQHMRGPDLVVTDLYMPGIDGWRFCRLLRSPEYRHCNRIPVLVVSATYSGEESERITADLGANAFLAAPVNGADYIEKVRDLLAGTQPRMRLRVLIVEDSRSLADQLKKTFESHGYHARIAGTAQAATEALHTHPFDVAIIDYYLPDGRGDRVLRTCTAQRQDCVSIMMTADPDPRHAIEWMQAGATAYVRKPFDREYIIELCAKARRERSLLRVEDLLEQRTQNLRRSEELFRTIYENAPVMIYGFDAARRCELWNEECRRFFRLTRDDLNSVSDPLTLLTPDNHARAQLERQVFTEPDGIFRELPLVNADREDIVSRWSNFRLESGMIVGIGYDLSEIKQVEIALRNQVDFTQRILDSTAATMAVVDPDGTIVRVNSAWRAFARHNGGGDASGCVVGDNYFSTCSPVSGDTRASAEAAAGIRAVQQGIRESFEFEYPCHSPTQQRWFQLRTTPVVGCRGQVLVAHTDITEQCTARAERERLMLAIEQTSDAIVITDTSGIIQYVNSAFERITGYARGEVHGKRTSLFKSGAHEQDFYAHLWETVSSGSTWNGRFVNRKKDGSRYTEEAAISPVFDAGGEIVNYVAVKRDITRELELNAHVQQLQKMEAIGTLAGGIAHDFNNILGGIIGFAEVALDEGTDEKAVQECLADILQLGLRARDLTQQILTFSRRQTPESLRAQPLQPVVEECVKMLRATIPSTIEIKQSIHQSCGMVEANSVQMQQLIMNLCTNAADEMRDSGGTLDVTLDAIEVEKKILSCDFTIAPGRYVRLRVGDTGPGIQPDRLGRIFEPFYTTKPTGRGTGLGLALIYGIVRSHGGGIMVDSQPGQGTTFSVLLPRASAAAVAACEEEPVPGRQHFGTGVHVLIVDDEQAIVDSAQRMLAKLGCAVTAVGRPSQALALVRDDPGLYDIVITDQTMPGMTGFDLAQRLLQIRPQLPIVLCTGYSESISESQALSAGISRFIMKPLTKHNMAETLHEVLDSAALDRARTP